VSIAHCKCNEIEVKIMCITKLLNAHLFPLPYDMRKRDILMEKKGNVFLNNFKKCIQITHSSLCNSLPKDEV